MFRLGSTSYVYPGDLVLNAAHLAGTVDDIELILFQVPGGESNIPTPAVVQRLADTAADHGLTYTVHLPLDLRWDHPSLQLAAQVMRLTEPLQPFAYVFHLEGTGAGEPGWAKQGIRAVEALLPLAQAPAQLALENLENYAPEYLLPVFEALPISRTLDIGHLWKMGRDPLPVLEAWLPHTRVIHLHGMAAVDHQSLEVMPAAVLDPVVRAIEGWDGVLTLEVFEDDFFTSREALGAALARVNP